MNASEIKNILDLHIKWLRDEEGGSRADLYAAYLSGANLSRADLRGADLSGADLRGAEGIMSFGPIGNEKRIGYAWLDKDGKAVIRLGCSEKNLNDTIAAIRLKYGVKSNYEAMVKLAAKIIEEQK